MKDYQYQFIEFIINEGVLTFGNFKLKSGRMSPYFFNMGNCFTGKSLEKLGNFYSQKIINSEINIDILFGPSYKGIPLVCSTAIALSKKNINIPWSFNRKEIKDHGEGGIFVGAPLKGDLLLIDDVVTAGTAITEIMKILPKNTINVKALLIALDRQEKTNTNENTIEKIKKQFQIDVFSIVTLKDILKYLKDKKLNKESDNISKYLEIYGINSKI